MASPNGLGSKIFFYFVSFSRTASASWTANRNCFLIRFWILFPKNSEIIIGINFFFFFFLTVFLKYDICLPDNVFKKFRNYHRYKFFLFVLSLLFSWNMTYVYQIIILFIYKKNSFNKTKKIEDIVLNISTLPERILRWEAYYK